MKSSDIPLGFAVGTGMPVAVPLGHMAGTREGDEYRKAPGLKVTTRELQAVG